MKLSKSWYDVILLILLYLISSTDFYASWISYPEIVFFINFTLRLGFIIFANFFIKKNLMIFPPFKKNRWQTLLILPLFFITFSNLLVGLITNSPNRLFINPTALIQDTSLALLVAVAEELIFRVVLFTQFKKYNKVLPSIIYSSLVFALVHLVGINSVASIVPVLIQVGYTFFLGLGCVLIYYLTQNFIFPILFHFSFNFLNNILTETLFFLPRDWMFYTINIVVGIICLVYGIWLYRFSLKKGVTIHVT